MEPRKASYFDIEVCKPFFHEGNDEGILLIHGFTGSCSHMRKLAEGLSEKGYTVKSINLPGHALTEDDMGKENWKTWLAACKKAVQELRPKVKHVTVAGLSMGGVISLILAEEGLVDRVITISAPMRTENKFLPLAGLAAPFVHRISWSDDPVRPSMLDQNYDKGYTGFPTAKGADLFKLIKKARKNLNAINCPLFSVQSTGDESVTQDSIDIIQNGAASKIKQQLRLKDVPHVCTISTEWMNIVNGIDQFVRNSPAHE